MASLDVVSKVQWNEIDNALGQAQKELAQRFDFQGTNALVEKTKEGLLVSADTEDRAQAAVKVVEEKLVRRKVSLRHIEVGEPSTGAKSSCRILIKVKEGIQIEKAREIIKLIKDSKLKIQGSILEEQVRITGKNRDDLQQIMRILREKDLGVDLQFVNFRD